MSCENCDRCTNCYAALAEEADMLDEVSAALCHRENLAAAIARAEAAEKRVARAVELLGKCAPALDDQANELRARVDAFLAEKRFVATDNERDPQET